MEVIEFWKIFLKTAQYSGAIVSFVSNSVLLILIFFRSPANLGTYKYLMIYIVIFRIIYPVLGVITEPTIVSYGSVFLVFRDIKNSTLGREESFFLLLSYGGCFGFSLALFAIHFIYRYGVADKKFRETYLSGCKLIVLFLIPAVFGMIWAGICYTFFHFDTTTDRLAENLLRRTYDTRIEDVSYAIVIFYQLDNQNTLQPDLNTFFAIGCLWSLVISSIFSVFYFGIKCYLRISRALPSAQIASSLAASIQHQLFMALVVQTSIPVILIYIPIVVLFLFPMLNVDVGILGSFIAVTMAIYPAIDPLPTMFIVKNFRDTLLCRTCGSVQITEQTAAVQHQPVAVRTTTV